MEKLKDFETFLIEKNAKSEQEIFNEWVKQQVNNLRIEQLTLEDINNDIGQYGEMYALRILHQKGYIATITPQSRTKGDIWGYKKYPKYYHFTIVQIKSSQNEPVNICNNKDEIESLKALTKTIKKEFIKYDKYNVNSPLIVSCGYLGVKIQLNKYNRVHNYKTFQPKLIKSYFHNFQNEELKTKAINKVEKIHEFVIE